MIKTATRKFPAAYLDNIELNARGDARRLVQLNEHGLSDMVAMVWVDRDRRKFISNVEGVANHPEPIVRKRWHQIEKDTITPPELVTLTIQQPRLVNTYYDACGEIDRHNHQCCDDLELEHML